MDDIVKQAMAKWPNVPHCYGWLALDARGGWRMRDERAQALKLAGDKISNPALLSFINRNYTRDEKGCWYFQNGPQRVYVTLEVAPYVAHTDPVQGFVLHTGEPLAGIDGAWMTDAGQLLLKDGEKIALVDDRDMAQCLSQLYFGNEEAGDERLIGWLSQPGGNATLSLEHAGRRIEVQHIVREKIADQFGFVAEPHADADRVNA
ncbi:DUF2946 family protein [Noviherbaspirillum autotrophicum]|uniref:DUF2946 domain-containing protein n=1 Tax=Noviherbaspirillum autotrophicum TaxID=709839 RepID=A0A0C1Y3P2_9BURK|nr:DUF2946 family protein [Noviherbaspirillum autotrophicum]KIF81723.1 hypothetical protein TSA66_14460 [Noviherbaspirillum autotrophicum]